MSQSLDAAAKHLSKDEFKRAILSDYKLACISRQASLTGRKEVLTGKAKFGIFGDGKEVAQIAMAKVFEPGDFRAGYYRDQTFMFARGMSSVRQFFAQLYAHTDVEADPASAGRSMNGHFGTRLLDEEGEWLNLTERYNSSSDISPTAGQMSRLVGLAWASKLYRNNPALDEPNKFSIKGNEIAFGTIGNASTSEGHFWESINAGGVLQIPMIVSIWDDAYGISVPSKYQTTKENLTSLLSGFKTDRDGVGYDFYTVKGWDYAELVRTYAKAAEKCRKTHSPAIIHITELTQPQGHSTSGSHERYKSKERLQWELTHDCNLKMRQWIIESSIATDEELTGIEMEATNFVREEKQAAWLAFTQPIKDDGDNLLTVLQGFPQNAKAFELVQQAIQRLTNSAEIERKEYSKIIYEILRASIGDNGLYINDLKAYLEVFKQDNFNRYSSHLHSESEQNALKIPSVAAEYSNSSPTLNGFEILQKCFDAILARDKRVVAFGEDLGHIGDVNQGFAGLQEKYGDVRVMDAGIRENTIIGQAIGAALRGLKPIAEIQYLDYLIYAIQVLSDDLASLQYRTKGGQKAPVIVRTRGHRLEGIWHSGSPMSMIINAVRGIHVLVPRNMVQAAGFYNLLLLNDEPAIVVECLNGYRLKERLPDNLANFTLPVGQIEVLIEGSDVTLVTYGSCTRIAEEAVIQLNEQNICVELIDIQSLLPFDLNQDIVKSIRKTNKLVVLDEDVPGGASAYILQQLLEKQQAFQYLDSAPKTISARAHRPAYGTDGDYFSKPNVEDVFTAIYNMMHEYNPERFPKFI